MADAIIYATAQSQMAELWNQEAHFEELPSVPYFPKPYPHGENESIGIAIR